MPLDVHATEEEDKLVVLSSLNRLGGCTEEQLLRFLVENALMNQFQFYLALGGLNYLPIDYFLQQHPEVKRVSLCFDRDAPGRNFTKIVAKRLAERGYIVQDAPPAIGKDYNDYLLAAHGRACAVATGAKRSNPDTLVFTYQGDGDLASIGLAETMSAANRGENISVIFVNNGIYGMTGGQLAPTTLVGMKATTAPKGRDPKEHGYPMHVCEILNQLTAPYYLERTSCNNPANVAKTKAAIRKAFQNQLDGKGFSLVEIVTSCPTNWGLEPLEALGFLEEKMFKEFPLGVIRDKDKEGA